MPVHRIDRATLEAALFGYGAQLGTIEVKIAQISRQLGGRAPTDAAGIRPKMPRQKRPMRTPARKRIAAAQKKRWAAYRKSKAE